MQVRKFEANTMKEALDMVKQQLGPEAIILSAKENQARHGLNGTGSVEVSAVVSELVLQKKRLAESKMTRSRKNSFSNMSAGHQKQYIDRVYDTHKAENKTPYQTTSAPYISIKDDEKGIDFEEHNIGNSVDRVLEQQEFRSENRVKEAVMSALAAGGVFAESEVIPNESVQLVQHPEVKVRDRKILMLERELAMMKKLVKNFKNVPQSFVSMHPGASEGLPYELGFMYEDLTGTGLDEKRTIEILKNIKDQVSSEMLKKKHFVKAWVARYLLDTLSVVGEENRSRFHAFVGSNGQGKTSSLVKYASHLVIRERVKVAIVTCDTRKVGASDQLKIFSQILNIPFCKVNRPEDWVQVEAQLGDVDVILVDYPANSLKTQRDYDYFSKMLVPQRGGRSIHYVQSVLAKNIDSIVTAKRYSSLGATDIVFTCLDETIQHGIIYNIHKEIGLPLHSFGIGPQIPEDFEYATKERVVDLLFKLTKVKQERGYL